MSKCKDNKILNPLTKRCVDINGEVARNLIKQYFDGKITLSAEDIVKLQKYGLIPKSNDLDKQIVKVLKSPQISSAIKNKLIDKLQKLRELKTFKYINKDHEKYCKFKDTIVPLKKEFNFSYSSLINNLVFNPNFTEKINFETKIANHEIKFNQYNKQIIEQVVDLDNTVDIEWIEKTSKYIKNLSIKDLYTIKSYTFNGDKMINSFIRDNQIIKTNRQDTIPTFFQMIDVIKQTDDIDSIIDKTSYMYNNPQVIPVINKLKGKEKDKMSLNDWLYALKIIKSILIDEFYKVVLSKYKADLNKIIKEAPPLTKKLVVYRGVKDDYFLKKNTKGFYKNEGFISTSMAINVSKSFINLYYNDNTSCCLKRITLLPGTKAIFLAGVSQIPEEYEVLLPSDSVYYLMNGKKTLKHYHHNIDPTPIICEEQTSNIMVTDVVVVK